MSCESLTLNEPYSRGATELPPGASISDIFRNENQMHSIDSSFLASDNNGLTALKSQLDAVMIAMGEEDAAHDISHLRRVASTAIKIGAAESANLSVLTAAAYFHDLVNRPKNAPDRHRASTLSARRAVEILKAKFPSFPASEHGAVAHAVEAHSFSAGIAPVTIEAKVLQDADRLEALGAIGIARVFYIAGRLGQSLFDGCDPLAARRDLDDKKFALDHFRVKLMHLHESMQTDTGKQLALENTRYLVNFVAKLVNECKGEMIGFDSASLELLDLRSPT